MTALMNACLEGHLEIVRELLGRGANVNAANRIGFTSLMAACQQGDLEVVRELLAHGANVNASMTTDGWTSINDGMTSLMWACVTRHLEIVRELLKQGANVNAALTYDGWTSLIWACAIGNLEIVKVLCQSGADPNIVNKDGNKAINLTRNPDIKSILIEGCPPLQNPYMPEGSVPTQPLVAPRPSEPGGNESVNLPDIVPNTPLLPRGGSRLIPKKIRRKTPKKTTRKTRRKSRR
jgi:ankyrin repeat protein